jgi:SAM-dependent methyltransferase
MIGTELLDDPAADPAAVRAQLRDIARLNAWFGGTRAVVSALLPFLRQAAPGATWTALDVGAGSGDILRAAAVAAGRLGVSLVGVALERSGTAARVANGGGLAAVVADGTTLPFAPGSVDVAIVSQVLHHLHEPEAVALLAALDRVARRAVVVADLRRSPLAMAGLWIAGRPLGLEPGSRRDAITSLRRGYTAAELERLLRRAGIAAPVRYRPLARVVAAWKPACAR